MKLQKAGHGWSPPATYFDWVKRHPLTSIKSDADLDAAQAVLDELLRQDLDAGASTYLDALSDLVLLYERERHAIPPLPPTSCWPICSRSEACRRRSWCGGRGSRRPRSATWRPAGGGSRSTTCTASRRRSGYRRQCFCKRSNHDSRHGQSRPPPGGSMAVERFNQ
jgi:hypothetical protein